MFELSVFNAAQIIDQLFDFICMYLLTSLSAKTRFYGFTIGFIGFISRHISSDCHRALVAFAVHADLVCHRAARCAE